MTPKLALDTNAYRALNDGNSKLANQVKTALQLGLPITVLGELYYGIFYGGKQASNLAQLNRFLATARLDILLIDEETAKLFGEISTELSHAGRPIQQNDIWIAALCKQHGYALATNNKGFTGIIGLEIIAF